MFGNIIEFFKSAQAPDGKTVWLAIGIFAGAWLLQLLLGMMATVATKNWDYWAWNEKEYIQDTFVEMGNSIFFYGIAYVFALLLWRLIPIVTHILIWALSIFSAWCLITACIMFVVELFGCIIRKVRIGDFVLTLGRLLFASVMPLCTYLVYFR